MTKTNSGHSGETYFISNKEITGLPKAYELGKNL